MRYILLGIFFLGTSHSIISQNNDIKFTDYTPRWTQVIQDTNFIPGNFPAINSYNSMYPLLGLHVEEEFSFIPFACDNGDYESDGAILVKVNNSNGEINWTRYMNTSNGDDQNFYTSFFVDDRIYYAGRKRTRQSIILNEDWQIGGYSKPFYREINKETGEIESEIFDRSDSIGVFSGFISKPLLPINGKIKQVERVNLGVNISNINPMSLLPIDTQFLKYPTSLSLGITKHVRGLFIRENDQNAIVYFQAISKDTNIEKHIGRLDYYEISNDSFELNKSIDFSNYVKTIPIDPSRNRIFYNYGKDGRFVICQSYQSDDFPTYRTWVLKLDTVGKVEFYKENLKIDSLNHYYSYAIPFFVDENNIFLLTLPSSTNEQGMDVVQLNKSGELILKGSLTTGNQFRVGIGGIQMSTKGDIIFALKWDQEYSVIMGMHISDFGINLSSNDINTIVPTSLMTISPNPATIEITLHITDEKYHQGKVEIYTLTGEKVLQQKISHGETLDVHNLLPGTYIVQFSPDSRPGYFLTTKLVKE